MGFTVKRFADLSLDDLYDILKARVDVFVVEQRCAYPEIDGLDLGALHVYCKGSRGDIAAYLRIFAKSDEPGVAQVGRVLTTERGVGLGTVLTEAGLAAARDQLGATSAYLEAQTHAVGFYERFGFRACSDEFLEDGIPHVAMRADLACDAAATASSFMDEYAGLFEELAGR